MTSKRDELIESIESALNFNKDGAEKFFDKVVSAIREELTPKDQTYQEFFGLDKKIQGYTAEQWQEIIDGGYLCEVANNKIEQGENWDEFGILGKVNEDGFTDTDNYRWEFCRPAQIKGVMRPIFVEPVDKKANCLFLYSDGSNSQMTWGNFFSGGLSDGNTRATKYIEV